MTYEQALSFIHGIPRFGKKPGLARIRELLRRMGDPQDTLRFVHVAGTNGKGSTCTMISFALREAGWRTGLVISPFVIDFRERMQIDGQMISEEELAEITSYVHGIWAGMEAEGMPPSEFEVVAAVAFEFFRRNACDVVVLEVGMGGRFDSTNVIGPPLVSVITSIGLDHMQYLGDTLEKIAFEKCGIIKPDGITVTSPGQPPEALAVIMEHCAARNNRLLQPQRAEILRIDINGSAIRYRDMELTVPLAGRHQIDNALTAVEACLALAESPCPVSARAIADGIAKTSFPSRMECFGGKPLVVLDGAHNAPGARALADALSLLEGRRIVAVTGMSEGKDAELVFSLVLPRCSAVILTAADSFKAADPNSLLPLVKRWCEDIEVIPNGEEALRRALEKCGPDDALLVFGSLYLTSELRPLVMEPARSPA